MLDSSHITYIGCSLCRKDGRNSFVDHTTPQAVDSFHNLINEDNVNWMFN
jgi:hypothetical protein